MLCWVSREGLMQKSLLSHYLKWHCQNPPKVSTHVLQLAGGRTILAEKLENSRKRQERQKGTMDSNIPFMFGTTYSKIQKKKRKSDTQKEGISMPISLMQKQTQRDWNWVWENHWLFNVFISWKQRRGQCKATQLNTNWFIEVDGVILSLLSVMCLFHKDFHPPSPLTKWLGTLL